MATTKRKTVAIMEVVSNGSPQKFFTREGECHRVSPLPKKYRELKPSQVGIQKSLVKCSPSVAEQENFLTNPHNLAVVHGLLKSAVKEALEEHERQRKEKSIILEDIVGGITMRSLVSDWSRTSYGKAMLEKMTSAVNDSYAKANDLPYHRRVQHGDLLTEIKHLTKEAEGKGEVAATTFLEKARSAIEGPSGLPGSEFLALVSAYVQTNQQVHVSWTEQKLKHVLELAGHNELQVCGHTPTFWIQRMVVDIAKENGWALVP